MNPNPPAFYFSSAVEAESAFYSAFEMGDIQLIEAVLAEQDVSCIHPGSVPIVGKEAVLASFIEIIKHAKPPVFNTKLITRSESDDLAVHLVEERIAADHTIDAESSLVIATNVYIRQKNGWRLLMHHASLPKLSDVDSDVEDKSIIMDAPNTLQ